MAKNFTDVCVTARTAEGYFNRMMKVYEFLKKENNKAFTPSEVALGCGYRYSDGSGEYGMVTKPLHWLFKMGLVDRENYTKDIPLESHGSHWEEEVRIIDGKRFTRAEWVEDTAPTYFKRVTCYKWFIKK